MPGNLQPGATQPPTHIAQHINTRPDLIFSGVTVNYDMFVPMQEAFQLSFCAQSRDCQLHSGHCKAKDGGSRPRHQPVGIYSGLAIGVLEMTAPGD